MLILLAIFYKSDQSNSRVNNAMSKLPGGPRQSFRLLSSCSSSSSYYYYVLWCYYFVMLIYWWCVL